MSAPGLQTRANHVRFDPPFHFFLVPVGLFLSIWSIVRAVRHPAVETASFAAMTVLLLFLMLKARTYSLKVQDRVIRLEERFRLSVLLGEPYRQRISELTEGQLVALRFAPDAEVPALVERALSEGLKPKAIKEAIVNWRGDYFRV